MKLRKLLSLVLALIMVVSVFSVITVSADEPEADPLIIHWDFEGDTLEEQLANKAENGAEVDTLDLIIADGDEYTKIDNGTAKMANTAGTYLHFKGGDSGTETDASVSGNKANSLNSCTEEYTVSVRLMTDTINGTWGDVPNNQPYFIYWGGSNIYYNRFAIQNFGGTVRPGFRFGGGGFTFTDVRPAQNTFFIVTFTAKANEDGSATFKGYLDGTAVYSETVPATTFGSQKIMSCWANMMFGAANVLVQGWGVYAEYDDIRIYNKELSATEVAALASEINASAPVESVDPGDFTFGGGNDETTKAKNDTTTAAKGDDTTAAGDDTTAAAEVEVKSGCGAAIMGMALIPAAVAVGAAVVSRKKKD